MERRNYHVYTPDEDSLMIELIDERGMTHREVADIFGVNTQSIHNRVSILQQRGLLRKRGAQRWSEEHSEIAADASLTVKEVARLVGCSENTVRAHISVLHRAGKTDRVKREASDPFTPEEDREIMGSSETYKEIGKKIGRSRESVAHRALHLRKIGRHVPRRIERWSDEHIAIALDESIPLKEAAVLVGRDWQAVAQKRSRQRRKLRG